VKTVEPHKLTAADVAEILEIDVDQVYQLIEAKELAALDVSRGRRRPRWRIAESELSKFIDRRRSDTTRTNPA
jgi:excisionase family DNA binding protein